MIPPPSESVRRPPPTTKPARCMEDTKIPDSANRPVGRPRIDRTTARSRIAILDAAEVLFAEDGFDATPTRLVAKKAGVTTGLVFYYFPTKKQLLNALIEERSVLSQIAGLLPDPDDTGDLRLTLETAGKALYDLIQGSKNIVRIVTSEVPHHRNIQLHWEGMLETVLRQLTAYVAQASSGTLTVERAAPLARVFFSTIAFHAIFDPDHDRNRLIDDLLAVIVPA